MTVRSLDDPIQRRSRGDVLLRRADSVLLQRRAGTGCMDDHWASSAAGHVERRESVVDAAIREVREELGVVEGADDLRAVCAMHRTERDVVDPTSERVGFFFTARNLTGDPRITEPGKVAALDWFDLRDLPEVVVPHERVVLESLVSGRTEAIVTHGF